MTRFASRVPAASVLAVLGLLAAAAKSSHAEPPAIQFGTPQPLPEFNAHFDRTDGWIGGDGDYSVPFGDGRTLWLYSDTWVGKVRDGKRIDAKIVNNTVALQRGGLEKPTIDFVIRQDEKRQPTALIEPADGNGFYWLQDGLFADGRLYLFLTQIEKTSDTSAWGFRQIGQWLGVVTNPLDPPTEWKIEQHKLPFVDFTEDRELTFGTALLREGDILYVYGREDHRGRRRPLRRFLNVARVPLNSVADFSTWQFYHEGDWVADAAGSSHLADNLACEASVVALPKFEQYVLVYTEQGMSPEVVARTASKPWGPWSEKTTIYRAPDTDRDHEVFCYAGKAHPSLATGDELVISYCTNASSIWHVAADPRIYVPQFVRVPLSR
jgi:hypothetical protein